MANNWPKVDIITLSFRDKERFPTYFAALEGIDYPSDKLELMIVDNGSADGALSYLRQKLPTLPFRAKLVEAGKNLGFGGGNDLGVQKGTGEYIFFLNSDTKIESDALRKLAERAASEPGTGLIEAAQYPAELKKAFSEQGETDWCSGAALLARREAFEALGGFDELFYPAYCEDVDLSWRMWLSGWSCIYEPAARVWHDAPEPGEAKPLEQRLSTKHSFAMHFIYDSLGGLASHVLRGLRYAISPRTEKMRRKGVMQGLWMLIAKFGPLMRRRRSAQRKMKENPAAREHIVFTEWYYGRWQTPADENKSGVPATSTSQ